MPNRYIAPYLISSDRPANVPLEGTFTVPVCTTAERFSKIMDALFAYGAMQGNEFDFDHLIDWLDALPRIVEGCVEFHNQCRSIALNSERVEWFPESPYNPGPEFPEGYDNHPWTIANNDTLPGMVVAWGLGYKNGDVFTDILHSPDITDPANFTEEYLNLPRFRLSNLEGKGTIKVDILSIPLGGRLVVVVDDFIDLLNLQSADTDRDASFPPESIVSITIETEITTEGIHHVDYIFYPTFETELPIIGFGGGVRAIEICGFGDIMPEENCCDETNKLLTKNNNLLAEMLKLWQGGFKLVPIDGISTPPDQSGGDCAPDHFDHDGDGESVPELIQRRQALCITIERYIKGILLAALRDMGAPDFIVDYIHSILASDVPLSLSALEVSYPVSFDGLSVFFLIVSSAVSFDELVCLMLDGLTGEKNNTFANFKESVPDIIPDGFPEGLAPLVFLMRRSNTVLANYKAFNLALNDAKDEDLDAYECPCTGPVADGCGEEPLELVIWEGDGTSAGQVITPLGGNRFRFEQTNLVGGRAIITVQDALGRCIKFEPDDEGQAVFVYNITGCPDAEGDCESSDASGSGGFAPRSGKIFGWQTSGAANTVYVVTCCEPS